MDLFFHQKYLHRGRGSRRWNLGWVDFNLDVPIIMPCLSAHSARFSLSQSRIRQPKSHSTKDYKVRHHLVNTVWLYCQYELRAKETNLGSGYLLCRRVQDESLNAHCYGFSWLCFYLWSYCVLCVFHILDYGFAHIGLWFCMNAFSHTEIK